MKKFLRALLSKKSAKAATPAARRVRPELEALEERQMLTVTNHGGAILSHVEVQAMYYGSDWQNNAAYHNQVGYLDGFLKSVVNSSYMDALGNAGYGVGRGTFDQGYVRPFTLDKTHYLDDSTLHAALVNSINGGNLKAPDANRLYVIFVEDNVAVQHGTETSTANFLGYHGAFGATIRPPGSSASTFADIRYAVLPYPGGSVPLTTGTVPNATRWWLNQLDTITLSASHEIAEAVTDPNVNYKTLGWYDDAHGEVGDITNAQTIYLNGYAVQRISDKNDQGMTPQGAAPVKAVNFVLTKDGTLYMSSSSGLTQIATGIASVSDQGIDRYGHAIVDTVSTNGTAKQYEEGIGWNYLSAGVKMAKAGQGVSYLLMTNGTVQETTDSGRTWTYIDSNVTAIDAGTDRYGVNMVTEIWNGQAWEHSDSTGWRYLASNVKAVSAGQMGNMAILYTNGDAAKYSEASGSTSFLVSGVAQVTAGTDENGQALTEVLLTNGKLWELHANGGWNYLDDSVTSVSKAHAGVLDAVFTWGYAYSHDDATAFHYLTANASMAV
jgi:hypothetical protein